MKHADLSALVGAAAIAAALFVFTGCSTGVPQISPGEPAAGADEAGMSGFECERELVRLDDAITARAAEGKLPPDRLVEARALRAEAYDLYLEGQYGLALQFIDEALKLLGAT